MKSGATMVGATGSTPHAANTLEIHTARLIISTRHHAEISEPVHALRTP
jgi:hypothetical protein